MGTKENPGRFDCYSKAEPDEPIFVLLGRDPQAGNLIRQWAMERSRLGEAGEVIMEALACAAAMDRFIIARRIRQKADGVVR